MSAKDFRSWIRSLSKKFLGNESRQTRQATKTRPTLETLEVRLTPASLTMSTAGLSYLATSITLQGSFDQNSNNDGILFNDGVTGTVTAATSTTLTVAVTGLSSLTSGTVLQADATSDAVSSGYVQVATITGHWIVTDASGGAGSSTDVTLPYAVANAQSGDLINFASSLSTATITLTSTLDIGTNLTIAGLPGATPAISGGSSVVDFVVTSAVTSATISSLTIENGNLNGGSGAGIQNNGTLTVSNVTLTGNSCSGSGGGIFNAGSGNLTLSNSTFYDNTGSYGGGGVTNTGYANITNCTFTDNSSAPNTGGGVGTYQGTTILSNSTLTGNNGAGGGVAITFGTLTMINDTIAGNTSGGSPGGGLYINANLGGYQPTTVTLINDTIANNGVASGGASGGIYENGGATLIIDNSIIANNTAAGGSGPVDIQAGDQITVDNSLITSTGNYSLANGSSNNNTSPTFIGLSTLGNYGGTTQTIALLPGSQAIAAGSATYLSGLGVSTDERGQPREVGGNVDMGAFESQGFTLVVGSGNNQSAAPNSTYSPLVVNVTANNAGDPVNGGQITFAVTPVGGAGATLATSPATISSGSATVTPTANGTVGSYTVGVSSAGVTSSPLSFSLTNQPLTLTVNSTTIADSSTTLTINGLGFSSTAADNSVSFNLGVTGTITSATSTQLTVSILTPPTALGALDATVTTNGIISSSTEVAAEGTGTWVVTDPGNGAGSFTDITLPYAYAHSFGGDTITFAGSLSGDTITLASTLTVGHNLTISGPGASALAISGGNALQVVNIASGVTASILSLTIENGKITGSGAGIANNGTLTLSNVALSGDTASVSGGGIYNKGGTLTLSSATFTGNSAAGYGGDIDNAAGAKLIAGNTTAFTSTTNVDDNGILDLNGFSNSVGGLNGSGSVIDSGAAATLTVNAGGFFTGNITGANTGLAVAGSSQTFTLAGANTYGGTTTINSSDILQAGSTTALSASSNVSNAGTMNLGGYSVSIGALTGAGTVTNNLATYQIDDGTPDPNAPFFNDSLFGPEPADDWVGNVFTATAGGTQLQSVSFYTDYTALNSGSLPSPYATAALYTGAPGQNLTLVPGSVNSITLNANAGTWITVPFAALQNIPAGDLFTAVILVHDVPGNIYLFTEDNSGSDANSYFDVNSPYDTNGTYVNTYNLASPNYPTLNGDNYDNTGGSNAFQETTFLRVNYATPAATLTVTGGGTFAGTLEDGQGQLALTVAGSSKTLTLSGNSTYSGVTTINSTDSLVVTGSETSPVTVSAGGTLGGTGTTGALTVSGTVDPGTTGLTASSANFSPGGTLTVNLSGSSSPLTVNPLHVTGALVLGGSSTLSVTEPGLINAGYTTVVTSSGLTGTFSSTSFSGLPITVTYPSNTVVVAVDPTVTASASPLFANATSLTITGAGFDSNTANDSVSFSNGVTGSVTAATGTTLILSLTGLSSVAASTALSAVVTVDTAVSASSQVATVIEYVASSAANIVDTSTFITINGAGFSTSTASDSVSFDNGVTGTVSSASASQLTVTVLTPPTVLGALDAVVTVNGVVSTSTQVGTEIDDGTWVVTDPGSGAGSFSDITLPYANAHSFGGDTITFAGTLSGDTITLTSTLTVGHNLTITGLGASNLAISGNHAIQDFVISTGVTASISSLTIENGDVTGSGGGIANQGTLTLSSVSFSGNVATANGSDIYNASGAKLIAGNGSAFTSTTNLYDNGILDLNGFSTSVGTFSGGGSVIDSGAAVTLTVNGGGFFTGNITGAGIGLTIAGSSQTLTLGGTDTYGGTTTINSSDVLAAGSNTALSASTNVSNAGTLNLDGYSVSIGALNGSGTVTNNLQTYTDDNGNLAIAFNNSLGDESTGNQAEDNWVGNVFTATAGGTQLQSISLYYPALGYGDTDLSTLPDPNITAALYMGSPGTGLTLVPGSVNSVPLTANSATWINVPFASLQNIPAGETFTAVLLIQDVPNNYFPFGMDNESSQTVSFYDVSLPNGSVNVYNLASPNDPTLNGDSWDPSLIGSGYSNSAPYFGVTMLRVNYTTPASTLTVTGGGTFAGTIEDGNGQLALTVAGTSKTLTLSGSSTYSGATTINSTDTLLVNGSESSPVTVSSGATLGGTGSVGALTVSGTVNSGSPVTSVGTLTASSATFASGGNLTVEITGSVGSVTADLLNVTGSLTLGGSSTLTIDENGLTTANGAVTVINDTNQTGQFSSFSVTNPSVGYQTIVAYPSTSVTITIAATVTASSAVIPATATTLTIAGTGFDSNTAHDNVSFSNGVSGTVIAATSTSLTVSLTGLTSVTGGTALDANVTIDSAASGSTEVAVVAPVVTPSSATLLYSATDLTIAGYGFDTNTGNDSVSFNDGVSGTVTSATSTSLTVSLTNLSSVTVVTPLDASVTVDGTSSGNAVEVASVQPPLGITSVTPTPTGFVLVFNQPVDPTTLVLYSSPGDTTLGAADITLVGASTGPARGSLVVDPTNPDQITFVETSGLLAPDTWTLTVTSAVKAEGGIAMTGDYSSTFSVASSSSPVLSVPSFARGPGQSVELSNTVGIPISINNASNVTQASFTLTYDPTLLTIAPTGALTLSSAATNAGLAITSYSIDGEDARTYALTVYLNGGTGLTTSSAEQLLTITASVPTTAPYLDKSVLNLSSVQVNGANGVGVSGVEVAAYLGDVLGTGLANATAASLVDQVGTGAGTGFSAFKDLDPVIIGGVNGGQFVNANDASLINEAASGATLPQIPAVPGGISLVTGGPDPYLYLSAVQGAPGQTVTETLYLDVTNPNGIQLTALDEAIAFDTSALQVSDVRSTSSLMSLGSYATASTVDNTSGEFLVAQAFMGTGLPPVLPYGTDIPVLQFNVTLNADMSVGSETDLTLLQYGTVNGETQYTAISDNEGALTFTPGKAPSNSGNAAVDGSVTVVSPTASTAPEAVAATTHGQSVVVGKSVSAVRRATVVSSTPTSNAVQPETSVNVLMPLASVVAPTSVVEVVVTNMSGAVASVVVIVQPDVSVANNPLTVSPVSVPEVTPLASIGQGANRSADPAASLSVAALSTNKVVATASTTPTNVKTPMTVLDEMYRLLGTMPNVPLGSGYDVAAAGDDELLADPWELDYLLDDKE